MAAHTSTKYLDEKQTAELLQLMENESMTHMTMIKIFIYIGRLTDLLL